MTETVVHLKPREQWRPGVTIESLRGELNRAVELPGVANIWTMPIINRIDMLSTGIRSEVGVKVFGSDLGAAAGRWRSAWRRWSGRCPAPSTCTPSRSPTAST